MEKKNNEGLHARGYRQWLTLSNFHALPKKINLSITFSKFWIKRIQSLCETANDMQSINLQFLRLNKCLDTSCRCSISASFWMWFKWTGIILALTEAFLASPNISVVSWHPLPTGAGCFNRELQSIFFLNPSWKEKTYLSQTY